MSLVVDEELEVLSARCERPYLHGGVVCEDVSTRTQQDELVPEGVLADELGIELGMTICQ